MPTSWVAASVRARLLATRRIGSSRARDLAQGDGLPAAIEVLAASPYGAHVTQGMSLAAAQREVAATLLWNLRLIAGWLPPGGVQTLQPLAAWFELANLEERLVYLGGGAHPTPYQLGRLAVAWQALARATGSEGVRATLARSRWGDPGEGGPAAWVANLRFRWAAWVAGSVPGADVWAATASALLAARIRFAPDSPVNPAHVRPFSLPTSWAQVASIGELGALLGGQTAWALAGIEDPADLWRAEARWWTRVRDDSWKLLVASRFAGSVITGAVGLLAYDAWVTRAALGAVARGASGKAVFDAVA